MFTTSSSGSSSFGTIAGVLMGIGALVAVIGSIFGGGGDDQQPRYAIPRQGPTVTDYTPNIPPQPPQPVVMKPNIPAPQNVPTYVSAYPWGYNAYIAAIANTPMQSTPTYQYYPVNDFSGGYYYSSPKVFEWNTDYGRTLQYNPPNPIQPPAPPGYMQPQFAYNMPMNTPPSVQQVTPMMSTSPQLTYNFGNQIPNQQTIIDVPASSMRYTYDFEKKYQENLPQNYQDAYDRTLNDGSVTFCKVPSCYNNDSTWRGWTY